MRDVRDLIRLLVKEHQFLSETQLKGVCKEVKGILLEENTVAVVGLPIVIAGDIHGQFFDLLELFERSGESDIAQKLENKYVFLGDFVDRGFNSVETLQLLLLLKLQYPSAITLIRGNHETRQITQVYGFYDECVRKYGNCNAWRFSVEVFDYLCVAATVDKSIFCVHGGLAPDISLLDQIRSIQRVCEIPHEGAFGDLVWSDPDPSATWERNPRGAGWLFGPVPTRQFNHLNGVELIARAHQLVNEGFKYMFDRTAVVPMMGGAGERPRARETSGEREVQMCGEGADHLVRDSSNFLLNNESEDNTDAAAFDLVTVWSAPNYCYRCGNVASILLIDEHKNRRFEIFTEVKASSKAQPPRNLVPYFI